jgi:cytochrome c oxidase cbb3-type subunit 2
MPAYPWLAEAMVDGELVARKMRALQRIGDPYTDEEIASAAAAVEGRTELDALVAYLQNLGTVRSAR